MIFPSQGLYCLTMDPTRTGLSYMEQARLCIEGGARLIQLRHKSSTREDLLDEARLIAQLCKSHGILFLINDDPTLALDCGADGVHLGQDDATVDEARLILGAEAMIGLSTHTRAQVWEAQNKEVDYIGYGPVFATGSKVSEYTPRGLDELAWVVKHSRLPVVPIGGIGEHNMDSVSKAGARFAAVISAATGAADIKKAVSRLVTLLQGGE